MDEKRWRWCFKVSVLVFKVWGFLLDRKFSGNYYWGCCKWGGEVRFVGSRKERWKKIVRVYLKEIDL